MIWKFYAIFSCDGNKFAHEKDTVTDNLTFFKKKSFSTSIFFGKVLF